MTEDYGIRTGLRQPAASLGTAVMSSPTANAKWPLPSHRYDGSAAIRPHNSTPIRPPVQARNDANSAKSMIAI